MSLVHVSHVTPVLGFLYPCPKQTLAQEVSVPEMVAHTFSSRTWEAEAGESLGVRSRSTVLRSGLHSETLSKKRNKENIKKRAWRDDPVFETTG